MDPVTVLISLYKGYGLGDAVQMSAVLRHVRHYRPHWRVDFQAETGREGVGYGIVDNVFVYGQPYPSDYYDLEVQIVLYDTLTNWPDRPNTRVTSCLHEQFGIAWDPRFGRYQINVKEEVRQKVKDALRGVEKPVAVHRAGDSAKESKDLTPDQAKSINKVIKKFGFTPLILDWRPDPLSIIDGVISVRSLGLVAELGRDAQVNCAVIAECEAFVGIDSGPSKCASATDTPALVVWTGHHPVLFHDPAPNTHHLVRESDTRSSTFFEENYSFTKYTDLVAEAERWLSTTL